MNTNMKQNQCKCFMLLAISLSPKISAEVLQFCKRQILISKNIIFSCLLFIYLFIYLFVCFYARINKKLSVSLFIYLFIYLFICFYTRINKKLSVSVSISKEIKRLYGQLFSTENVF